MRNCKKGDMAIVIRSSAGNEGKIVTCLEYIGALPSEEGFPFVIGEDWWRVDQDLTFIRSKTNQFSGEYPFARDSQLMPISPSGEQIDEFSSEVDKEIDFELKEFYGNTLALVPKRKEGAY